METKEQAMKKLESWNTTGMVYQFPRGHWRCCTLNSEVGQDLLQNNMIYSHLGIAPQQWSIIFFPSHTDEA